MLLARQGGTNHTETLLFCLPAKEKLAYRMQHFFMQKVILILHLTCILL